MQGIPDDDNNDDDLMQGDDDDAYDDEDDDDNYDLVQGIPGLSSQGDTLKKIAAKKIRDRWSDNDYFPSNEEIFTVKTLGKNKSFMSTYILFMHNGMHIFTFIKIF